MRVVYGWSRVVLVLVFSSVSMGLYFVTDYYMDDGWPSAFGQICGETVEDDCLYINSHLNSLGILNYADDISCMVQLNAGNRQGARYKITFKRFDLEYSENCDSDYLTIYDTEIASTCFSAPAGKFCGNSKPNITGFPTQQFVTLKFRTDSGTGRKGFRIMATRTLPYPCHSDLFHCKAENRCIDGRLRCDGTAQCDDETDEDGCSFWEKVLGGFLALGLSTIVGIVFLVVIVCTGICVTICICTCCKKRCGCCKKYSKSCSSGVEKVKTKLASATRNRKTHAGKVGNKDDIKIADETTDRSLNNTTDMKLTTMPGAGRVTDSDDRRPSNTSIQAPQSSSPPRKGKVSGGTVVTAGVTTSLCAVDSGVTKVD